jgi:hypothetical protein
MAYKTGVISEFFEQQFLASKQRILNIDDHANISVFDIGRIIFIVWRCATPALLGHSVDHSTHRLNR